VEEVLLECHTEIDKRDREVHPPQLLVILHGTSCAEVKNSWRFVLIQLSPM
jgi:hypothetical protein